MAKKSNTILSLNKIQRIPKIKYITAILMAGFINNNLLLKI